MGRGFVEYHLSESKRDEWVLFSAFIYYRFADGSKLHIPRHPAWCAACDRFVIAEEIPSIEKFEEEIAKFRSGDPDTLRVWAFLYNDSSGVEHVAELQRYVEWRRGRRSPAHCLQCGALDPVPIPMIGEFAHPRTGERVVVGNGGFADTATWCAEFSPEGELLTPTGASADGEHRAESSDKASEH
jgi:hypothetical protein